MIFEMTGKEIMHGIRGVRVISILTISVVLLLISLISGSLLYLSIQEETARLVGAERDRLSSIIDFREDFIDQGVAYYRVPSPMMILVRGVEGDAARRANVGYLFYPEYDFSTLNATPLLAVFGMLDFEFLVKIVLSLFALLFTFDAVSGEKESGTLKLCLANGISRASIILSKLVGNSVLLLVPFVVASLTGMAVTKVLLPEIPFSAEEWLRFLLLLAASCLYLLAFLALGILFSSLFKRSFISLLALLLVWITLTAVVPRFSIIVTSLVQKVPSDSEIKREFYTRFSELDRELGQGISRLWDKQHDESNARRPTKPVSERPAELAEYNQRLKEYREWFNESQLLVNAQTVALFTELSQKLKRDEETFLEPYRKAKRRQNELARSLASFISPTSALAVIMPVLAETDIDSAETEFREAIENENRLMNDTVSKKLNENPLLGGFRSGSEEIVDMSGEYRPDLQITASSVVDDISEIATSLISLVIMCIVLIFAGIIAFSRYDAR